MIEHGEIEEKLLNNIIVYPNPFTDNISISFNAIENGKLDIRLFDVTGKLIFKRDYFTSKGKNAIIVDTSNLLRGMYIITAQDSSKLQSFKLIKDED